MTSPVTDVAPPPLRLECVLRRVAELTNGQTDPLAQLDVEPRDSQPSLA